MKKKKKKKDPTMDGVSIKKFDQYYLHCKKLR